MKKILALLLALLLIPLANAQIAVKTFDVSPSSISPGDELQLRITLENVGSEDIKDILVKIDLSQVPFAPLRSSTEQIIDEINNDDQEVIYFTLVTLPNAEPQIYKIPIKISYDNITKDSLISVEVSSKAKLDVILEDSTLIKVNDNGKITLKLINNGLGKIKFLKTTLEQSPAYEILSSDNIYIGDVDVGDFETAEFTIIPKIKNPQIILNVNYKDSNNNELQETKHITLKVYTEEEARQLGLVKNNSSFSIIIIILVLIIIFIIYRKIRKKKNDQ